MVAIPIKYLTFVTAIPLKNMKRRPLVLLQFLLVSMAAMAVPALRTPFTVTQPNGTSLTLILQGDERYHWLTTESGMPVRLDENGMYVPRSLWEMTLSRERSLAQSTRRESPHPVEAAHRPRGEQRVLVLLAQFTDVSFSRKDAKNTFKRMLNDEGYTAGGGFGSARDYFVDQSGGLFTPQFDVCGPYTLAHEMAYYGGNDEDGQDKAAGDMVREVLKLANEDVNYKDYDTDGNGTVDFVYVIYAGYAEAQGGSEDCVWPHKWYLAGAVGSALKLDGVQINQYACSSELHGNSGTDIDGIGTLCHEFSHCLGLPDFYDTTEEDRFGMYTWSIMDCGCYNEGNSTPAGYTAYEKEFLGWIDIETLDSEQEITLTPTAEGGKAYRIESSENTNEYYIVENIQQRGWNRAACGHGLLITHVDYLASIWDGNIINSTDRQRMTIVAADNKWMRNHTSAAGDTYPGSSGNTELTDYSIPAALTNDGSCFSKPLTDIREEDDRVTFCFMKGCGDITTAQSATDVTSCSFTAHWSARPETDDYTLEVFHITGDIPADNTLWTTALLNSQGELVQTYRSSGLQMQVGNLEADNLYGYRVRCLSNGVLSPYSNLIFVRTSVYVDTLGAPTLFKPEALNDSTLHLSWTPVEGAEAYILEYQPIAAFVEDTVGDGSQIIAEQFGRVDDSCGEITRVLDLYTDLPDWRGQEVHAQNGCVLLGSSETYGALITPYLPHGTDYVTIQFSVAKYNKNDEKPILHICLATDANDQYYVDQVGAYITSSDFAHYYCVLGPLDTNAYIAFITNSITDSDDNPMVLLDNVFVTWGDISEQFSSPQSNRLPFNGDEAKAPPHQSDHPGPIQKIPTSTSQHILVDSCSHLINNLPDGRYSFRVRAVQGKIYSPYSPTYVYEMGGTTFEEDGIAYDILSDERKIVAVTHLDEGRRYKGDVIIPSTVSHDGTTYSVTSLADSVFYACDELQSAVIPPSVTFAGNHLFRGCRKLAWVDWQSTTAIDSTAFIGTLYNTLVYVNAETNVEAHHIILIRDGQTNSITLDLNNAFLVPRPFHANHIEYLKDFSQPTLVGATAGWETLVLPFDVQKVESETRGMLSPFGSNISLPHYWIAEYNGSTFEYRAEPPKANVPCIVSFPNSSEYSERDRINGVIRFSADDVEVQATVDVPSVRGEKYDFVPVYSKVYQAESRYMLNIYDEDCNVPEGSVWMANRMSLRAFGAYMESHDRSAAPRFDIRFAPFTSDEQPTPAANDVYATDGRLVRKADEAASIGQTEGLLPGIYIIGGKKTIVLP